MAVSITSVVLRPNTRPKNNPRALPLAAVRRSVIFTALYGRPTGLGLVNVDVWRFQKPKTMSLLFSAGVIEVLFSLAAPVAASVAWARFGSFPAAARAAESAERWSCVWASAM